MTQRAIDAVHPPEHQEVWEILPWYVNGTLDDGERARVAVHLATCAVCREELARSRDLAAAVQAAAPEAWKPSSEHLARLMARLDATTASATPRRSWWNTVRTQYERSREMLRHTPPLIRWSLVTQSGVIVICVGLVVWPAPWVSERFYRTLSSSSERTPQKRMQIQVVFADDISEKELRTLLTEVRGTIVDGPSPVGVYMVAVALPGEVPAPAARALDMLRAHPKVRLAEVLPTR